MPPEFASIGEVKVTTDRRSQVGLQYACKTLVGGRPSRSEWARDHVAQHAESKARIESEEEVDRLEGEVNPTPSELDAPVTRTVEKIVTEQLSDIVEYFLIGRRMQSVAAVVQVVPAMLEAAGVAAEPFVSFDKEHVRSLVARQAPCRTDAGWTATEDSDSTHDWVSLLLITLKRTKQVAL